MMKTQFAIAMFLMLVDEEAIAGSDAAAGEKVFQRCNGCHEGHAGATQKAPTLRGIVGRPVASVEGFAYSDGLKAFAATGAVWGEAPLDTFLQDINGFVKGMRMAMTPIYREADRANLIAFLKPHE